MTYALVDAADVVELIEILEYLLETLGNDLPATPLRGCPDYHTDDLRADLTRLVDHLNQSPLTP